MVNTETWRQRKYWQEFIQGLEKRGTGPDQASWIPGYWEGEGSGETLK